MPTREILREVVILFLVGYVFGTALMSQIFLAKTHGRRFFLDPLVLITLVVGLVLFVLHIMTI